jgi:tetraacyldisaccharide 4'-kinase
VIRPLAFLAPLYHAAVSAKNAAYDKEWKHPRRLKWPVVSIGNLSVGGSGKTPLVIRLAELLSEQNVSVDVLSRGYGRGDVDSVERVNADGDAARFGDEPLLIARATKVPVYVCVDRYEAGLLAERDSRRPVIHLLDDGFQHRKLARALDTVVVHSSDLEEALLPVGRLREPLDSLKRASVVVLRAEDRQLETELRRRGISAPVWIQHRKLIIEPATRAVVFCGIARPDEFFAALRAQSVELSATRVLADHQSYTDSEIGRLIALARRHDAQCFVTTEKDAVRLSEKQREQLEKIAPLRIARLEVSLEDEGAVLARLRSLL